jgi:hypothetical protein
VEISVPGCPDSIFLVPDDQADELRAKARNPGRCWSHSEVAALRSQGATTNEAVKIAEAKMLLHAGALWTRPGKAEREADQKAAEQSGLSFE